MAAELFSDTVCELGEGPLWHPMRGRLLWFDITGKRLFEHDGERQTFWRFDRAVSAAGWVDEDRVIVATARDIVLFNLKTGRVETVVCALEPDNPVTRSNDGRADPQGGFWIGTMGFNLEDKAGAIYRYYRGELRKLYPGITIPNAICFTPDGGHACFCDTRDQVIRKVALDSHGWPRGEPEPFIDLRSEDLKPDGAVIDADGNLWNAQWNSARVAIYGPDGALRDVIPLPVSQTTCPAFGGEDFSTLYVTSAASGAPESDANAGRTFRVATGATGQREHRVTL